RDARRAARLPDGEPRDPHPGSAARDRKRDPPLMLDPISNAQVPADVRAGGAHGRKLYDAALGFEQQLVQSLASQLSATTDATDDADASSDDGDPDTTSTDAASSLVTDQLPDALAQGVTASGGLGLAHDLYLAMQRQGK